MRKVQILGTGCQKCKVLAERTEQAVAALGVPCSVEKVTDIADILAFGVMSTPALAVDGVVKVAGRVPTVDAIKDLLR